MKEIVIYFFAKHWAWTGYTRNIYWWFRFVTNKERETSFTLIASRVIKN